jgi:hypothetical protein
VVTTPKSILNRARSNAIRQGLLRMESFVISGFSLFMVSLCALNLFWYPQTWPFWLGLGVFGVAGVVFVSVRDEVSFRKTISTVFNEALDSSRVRVPELQDACARAMHIHSSVAKSLGARKEALGGVAGALDEWTVRVFDTARALDTLLHHNRVVRDLKSAVDIQLRKDANMMDTVGSVEQTLQAKRKRSASKDETAAYNRLIAARDTVALVREKLAETLLDINRINEMLRLARDFEMEREHIVQLQQVVDKQIGVIGQAQQAVYSLGQVYKVKL